MNIDDALKFTQSLIANHTKKPLIDSQMNVLRGCLEGKSYKEMYDLYKISEDYSKEIGSDLWKILSEIFCVKVTKNNLRNVIQKHLPPEKEKISDLQISPKCNEELRNFVGRDTAINDINNLINEGEKIIVIQAAGGVGKSTLAKQYLNNQGFELVLPLEMAKDKENFTAVESVVEEWLKQHFQEEPGREFGITLSRLKTQLQTRKVGVLIDNLEPALDEKGRFVEKHNLYVELLRVLADENVQSITLITSRERLCDERVNGISHYPLSVLDVTAWAEFFTSRKINIDTPSLEAMHKIYGGNAKAMDILLGVMRTDYNGDMSAYWQENCTLVETELKNLVGSQFKRLQTLDTEAYKLLCRLGCFRYQDVPRVSINALLALLWDISEDKQRDVIKSLRSRCLVEFEKGEYWLHPVIREQGIERLKTNGEWKEVNCKAAEFWNNSIVFVETRVEGLKKVEAYQHYAIIQDWNHASEILVQRVGNNLLISRLRSFGYMKKCSNILELLQDKPNINNHLSSQIWAHLAIINSIRGNLQSAIYEYETAINILKMFAEEELDKDIYVDCCGTLAILYINIGEYNKSNSLLERIIPIAKLMRKEGEKFLSYIYSCLSIINLYTQKYNLSLEHLNQAIYFQAALEKTNKTWIKSYGFYNLVKAFIAHNQIIHAVQLCEFLFTYSEKTSFPQAKGFSLCGFGEIYRNKNLLKESCDMYTKAIEIFQEIGAKCNLAEAYYELGITYQKMGETENSNTNFNEAIRLFNEMEAPKQVEKVEKAKIQN